MSLVEGAYYPALLISARYCPPPEQRRYGWSMVRTVARDCQGEIAEGPKIFRRIFLSKNFQPAAQAFRAAVQRRQGMVEVRSSNAIYMSNLYYY